MTIARYALVSLCILSLSSAPCRARAQPERKGFWASIQPGYGSLVRSSHQEAASRADTFALGFLLGGSLNRHLRFGIELNGWLLEAFDVNDPAKGESVSQAFAIIQAYPLINSGLFMRAGVGQATYANRHPLQFGSSGWGKTLGLGYDVPVCSQFFLTPAVNYSCGGLGSVHNQLANVQNRRYRAIDFGLAITYR